MIYDLPRNLRALSPAFDLRGMTVGGPVTLQQRRQVLSSDGGYWVASLNDIAVAGRDKVLAFRAFRAKVQGGAHQARVPVCDAPNAPWPVIQSPSSLATFDDLATFSDGGRFNENFASALSVNRNSYTSRFSDGATFNDGGVFKDETIAVRPGFAGSLRDTILYAKVMLAGEIKGGEYFSIGDNLYTIVQVLEGVTLLGTATQAWQILPPLRAAITTSDQLNFDDPVCAMTLASEAGLDLALEAGKFGGASPVFYEAFPDG